MSQYSKIKLLTLCRVMCWVEGEAAIEVCRNVPAGRAYRTRYCGDRHV